MSKSEKTSHWSKIQEKGAGYWRLRLLLLMYRYFGRFVLQIAILPAVLGVFLFSGSMRNFSGQYLQRIYKKKITQGDSTFPEPNLWSVFKHFYTFADSLADKMVSWEGKIGLESLKIETPDGFNDFNEDIKAKRGPFLICSHLGNIEVFRALGKLKTKDGTKERINIITQIAHSPFFSRFMAELHPEVETNLISAIDINLDTVIFLKEILEKGEMVVSAGDRTAALNESKSLEVEFLNEKASIPLGVFTLAILLESPIYFVFLLKEENKFQNISYKLYFYKAQSLLESDQINTKKRKGKAEKLAQEFIIHLERLCLQYPFQWYNFFDFWKAPSEDLQGK